MSNNGVRPRTPLAVGRILVHFLVEWDERKFQLF